MNILLFTRCMGSGGTETVIIQLARCYREAGHSVVVCAEDGPGGEKLRRLGFPFIPIPDMQSKHPAAMLEIFTTVLKLLRAHSIDVVHTHHRMAAFYARLLRPLHRFVFLNNVHNTFTDKRVLTRFALGKAMNIAVGEAVKTNMLRDYGISEAAIRVIPNAVEPPRLSGTRDPLLAELRRQGKFIIANIGRVNTQKGYEYYLQAAKLLQGYPFHFLVVGDGDRLEEIRTMAAELGLSDSVSFLGFRRDVADVIDQCDLTVLSSLWEGFPLTPIEVFSVGKTIVATQVPGTLEIVTHEENGLTVPLRDPQAIAAAIVRLYEDEALRRRLEREAQKTYLEKFSYRAFCAGYLALIDEVTHESA